MSGKSGCKAKCRKVVEVEREESNDKEEQTTSEVSDWLRSELQLMMYGLGDCRRPLVDSVRLVETILRQQMALLVDLAGEVRTTCGGGRGGGGGGAIAPHHFLFLLTHDKVKLGRLVQYMCLKDSRGRLMADVVEGQEVGPVEEEVASEEEDEPEPDEDLSQDETDEGDTDGAAPDARGVRWEAKQCLRRRQICLNFLKQMDQTGELLSLLDKQPTDEVKLERHLRLEKQTRFMETEQYVEFSQARTASFGRKHRLAKFRDWILSIIQPQLKLNAIAMEILSYLAYETVAQLIDLALVVKSERQTCGISCHDQHNANTADKARPNRKRRKDSGSGSELCVSSAVQPSELVEAMRRFNRASGAMATFAKSYTSPLRRKLLCC